MRTPPGYEKMILEIMKVASKYRFIYRDDTLKDYLPDAPGNGHEFEVHIHLHKWSDDFIDDAPILVSS